MPPRHLENDYIGYDSKIDLFGQQISHSGMAFICSMSMMQILDNTPKLSIPPNSGLLLNVFYFYSHTDIINSITFILGLLMLYGLINNYKANFDAASLDELIETPTLYGQKRFYLFANKQRLRESFLTVAINSVTISIATYFIIIETLESIHREHSFNMAKGYICSIGIVISILFIACAAINNFGATESRARYIASPG